MRDKFSKGRGPDGSNNGTTTSTKTPKTQDVAPTTTKQPKTPKVR